jgi:hypothetical protein
MARKFEGQPKVSLQISKKRITADLIKATKSTMIAKPNFENLKLMTW